MLIEPKPTTKVCKDCRTEKSLSDFYFRSKKHYSSYCKSCEKQRVAKWIKARRKIVGSTQWKWKKYYNFKKLASRRRGAEGVTLSFKDYWLLKEIKECFYCGEIFESLTIDRVDNDNGYHLDNLVMCCRRCNAIKGCVTPAICLSVVNFLNGKFE